MSNTYIKTIKKDGVLMTPSFLEEYDKKKNLYVFFTIKGMTRENTFDKIRKEDTTFSIENNQNISIVIDSKEDFIRLIGSTLNVLNIKTVLVDNIEDVTEIPDGFMKEVGTGIGMNDITYKYSVKEK